MPRIRLSKLVVELDSTDLTAELLSAFTHDGVEQVERGVESAPSATQHPPSASGLSADPLLPAPPLGQPGQRLLPPAQDAHDWLPAPLNLGAAGSAAYDVQAQTAPATAQAQVQHQENPGQPRPARGFANATQAVSTTAVRVTAGVGGAVRASFRLALGLVRLGFKLNPWAWAVIWLGLALGIGTALLRSHDVVHELPDSGSAQFTPAREQPEPPGEDDSDSTQDSDPPPASEPDNAPPPPRLAPEDHQWMPALQ